MKHVAALVLLLCALPGAKAAGEDSEKAIAFAEEAGRRIEEKPSVRGDEESWFFLVQELRHIAKGDFWNKPWEQIAANGGDPVASMLEFQELLEDRGIRLIIAPVPAKARIYPDRLDSDYRREDPAPLTPFIELLQEAGLTVLDFDSAFRELRGSNHSLKLYCAQDAHYSPEAIEFFADRVVLEMEVESAKGGPIVMGDETTIQITGDQVVGSEWEGNVEKESLTASPVLEEGKRGITPNPESPFLLLGDSHTLVFHEGAEVGMHFRGAGLVDQLSHRLGEAIDLVGVRGSGMVQARKQLYFRAASEPGFWDRKKIVIWVFSEREWTQSTDRLVSIPLDR